MILPSLLSVGVGGSCQHEFRHGIALTKPTEANKHLCHLMSVHTDEGINARRRYPLSDKTDISRCTAPATKKIRQLMLNQAIKHRGDNK